MSPHMMGMQYDVIATINYSQTSPNLSCQIPIQPLLQMVQHVPDWVAPFPSSSPQTTPYSPPLPHKLLHIPPLLLSLMRTRVRGNYDHHQDFN